MRRLLDTVRDEWPRLVLELVVLVVGISASFALEEWRGDQENARVERRAWEAVREELAADTLALVRQIARSEAMARADAQLLAGPPPDSVDTYLDLAISYAGFTPTDNAYVELRNTSAQRQLRHRALFAELSALHNREYERAAQWDRINSGIVLQRILPYLEEHAPTAYADAARQRGTETVGLDATWQALRDDRVFRNLLATQKNFRDAHTHVYALALARARAVLARVDRLLAGRPDPG
jgi:hypothetical protein